MKYIELNVIATRVFNDNAKEDEPKFQDYPQPTTITVKLDLVHSIRPNEDGKALVELATGRTWVVDAEYTALRERLVKLK